MDVVDVDDTGSFDYECDKCGHDGQYAVDVQSEVEDYLTDCFISEAGPLNCETSSAIGGSATITRLCEFPFRFECDNCSEEIEVEARVMASAYVDFTMNDCWEVEDVEEFHITSLSERKESITFFETQDVLDRLLEEDERKLEEDFLNLALDTEVDVEKPKSKKRVQEDLRQLEHKFKSFSRRTIKLFYHVTTNTNLNKIKRNQALQPFQKN
ncbi:E3 UFM1-protein ligase [Acrasis kona]|uniref:E3 UFM1-protein ligase n=1 Tax=Acrasis kona TaxID=1008807 RepID=A0AAW2YU27_9EUKA